MSKPSTVFKNENWLSRLFTESKKHLTPELMNDFVFNLSKMKKPKVIEVQSHIDDCKRCAREITLIQSRKEFYLSTSSPQICD